MSEKDEWAFPRELQPRAEEVAFDLGSALAAVVSLRADVPDDAFTSSILGTERTGNGIVIRDDGLILTIGYLITEAETIWITANDGTVVKGYPLAYDFPSGLGLVQPLGQLGRAGLKPLPRGSASSVDTGDEVIVIGNGGQAHALKARINDKREFAGYWEYVLDEALFTAPAHPEWSGAALVGDDGHLLGIGSLLVQEQIDGDTVHGNMFVPIDLLAPIIDDLTHRGRRAGLVRPWLGLYAAEVKDRLVVSALASGGPAERAGVRPGDLVLEVGGQRVSELAPFFRAMWRMGPAGTDIPLVLVRDGARVDVRVHSADRGDFLKKPSLQ
jgi:S1-C subfamily serine protease